MTGERSSRNGYRVYVLEEFYDLKTTEGGIVMDRYSTLGGHLARIAVKPRDEYDSQLENGLT